MVKYTGRFLFLRVTSMGGVYFTSYDATEVLRLEYSSDGWVDLFLLSCSLEAKLPTCTLRRRLRSVVRHVMDITKREDVLAVSDLDLSSATDVTIVNVRTAHPSSPMFPSGPLAAKHSSDMPLSDTERRSLSFGSVDEEVMEEEKEEEESSSSYESRTSPSTEYEGTSDSLTHDSETFMDDMSGSLPLGQDWEAFDSLLSEPFGDPLASDPWFADSVLPSPPADMSAL